MRLVSDFKSVEIESKEMDTDIPSWLQLPLESINTKLNALRENSKVFL